MELAVRFAITHREAVVRALRARRYRRRGQLIVVSVTQVRVGGAFLASPPGLRTWKKQCHGSDPQQPGARVPARAPPILGSTGPGLAPPLRKGPRHQAEASPQSNPPITATVLANCPHTRSRSVRALHGGAPAIREFDCGSVCEPFGAPPSMTAIRHPTPRGLLDVVGTNNDN